MKIKLKHSLPVAVAAILLSIGLHAQNLDAYNFPIKPGTDEWDKLKSYDEKLNAHNVPENILKEMSTDGLIETCLSYPEFRLVMTRNSLQEGYNYVKSIFNGFRELESRPDAGIKLLEKYQQMDPVKIKTFKTLLDKGRYGFQFTYLELLLSQHNIVEKMSSEQRSRLGKQCVATYQLKEQHPEEYYLFDLRNPARVISRILNAEKHENYLSLKLDSGEKANFQIDKMMMSKDDLQRIVSAGKEYFR